MTARLAPDLPRLLGGALALDFVNTVDFRHRAARREYLTTYPALVAWAPYAGALDRSEADDLLAAAEGRPVDAADVRRRAIRLREALYRILAPASAGREPAATDLAVLNRELDRAQRHAALVRTPTGYGWRLDATADLDRVLWPIARSAAALLVDGRATRIGECPGRGGECGWLFLDTTRSARRRWCAMATCGNREKARRHYARVRPRPSPPAVRPGPGSGTRS